MTDEDIRRFLRSPAFAVKDGQVTATKVDTDRLFGKSRVRWTVVVAEGLFQKTTVQRHRQMQPTSQAED